MSKPVFRIALTRYADGGETTREFGPFASLPEILAHMLSDPVCCSWLRPAPDDDEQPHADVLSVTKP